MDTIIRIDTREGHLFNTRVGDLEIMTIAAMGDYVPLCLHIHSFIPVKGVIRDPP